MPNVPVASLFVGFFLLMGVAIAASHRPQARGFGLALLTTLIFVHGLVGRTTWPFFSWHLYAFRAGPEVSFAELRLVDEAGRELRYDPRAIPPSLPTPLRRLAGRLPELPAPAQREISDFLVGRAETFRSQLRSGLPWWRWLRFPPHQWGWAWSSEAVAPTQGFQRLRVYRNDVRFDPQGRHIMERRSRLVWETP